MAKIAFIAPYKEMYLAGQKVIKDLGIQDITESYLSRNDHAVPLAKRLVAAGVEVVVTRGGTATLIIKAGIEVPVIEIPIGAPELVRALVDAKKITGLQNPVIAVLAFRNMIYQLEVLSDILGVELMIYELSSTFTIPMALEKLASEKKADIVLSGIHGTRLARQKGMKTVELGWSEASLHTAFMEAKKVAYARKLEQKRSQTFRVLIDYSVEGIISTNSDRIIEVFNPTAERLLGVDADNIIGKKIDDVFPVFDVATCLKQGQSLLGQIVKVNKITTLANIAPVKVVNDLVGAMITFQDISKITEMESKIRKAIYAKGLVAEHNFADILGVSSAIQHAKEAGREFAKSDATVMIIGSSGAGKELFAQSIHNCSKRRNGPFVAVNCAAIPASLLESELFGYVEGAFTGANRKGKAGLFELAHTGTIFLDEISEMDKYGQSRLLRVVQEKQVMRLGDDKYIPIDVRIIAATNRNLLQLVKDGMFREDLYYRLHVLSLHIPQLKERQDDIIILAEHYIKFFTKQYFGDSNKKLVFEPQALKLLKQYDWPGNVRELRNVMERLVIMAQGEIITVEAIRDYFDTNSFTPQKDVPKVVSNLFSEKERILQALIASDYNQGKAAELLGVNRSTLYRKQKKYQIDIKRFCNK